jgi:FAD/FMN-containing dehydrogenase
VAGCEFAVKSGGHAAFEGASNIQGGLTIDLANLNEVTVRSDNAQTAVGAGNNWYDVYTKIQPMGLSVIGGRVSAIGVGGLTLGGGISFFSSRYGWACDNVDNYEVVFADGSIREVSYSSDYSDLYWALRGGGNNFGIVTRFDLMTFPQGDLWAGSQAFVNTPETSAAINEAFFYLGVNAPSDPYAQVILAYAYVQAVDTYLIASDLQYGKPIVNPPVLQNFTAIQGAVSSTLRIVDLASLSIEFNNTNPGGFRYV